MQSLSLSPAGLRAQTIGVDAPMDTPFGTRLLTYCDYTASGRALQCVENYLQQILVTYANSHTEDDETGRVTTTLLLQAETQIKAAVNAGPEGKLLACGAGATSAVYKMQQLIGVALAPATQALLQTALNEQDLPAWENLLAEIRPVVFVGPYEHHSNELMWRESLCEVVEIGLTEDGQVDLQHLQQMLRLPQYQSRLRIGSFSAASNVTGLIAPVHEIAALLHQHNAWAFFDYAASAPYVSIDMNPIDQPDAYLDAIFISPHKFLGGPGASGILVFNERCYARDLAPSVAGGGTVTFVWPQGHDFIKGIEEREKAGTPAILQTIKAALAFQIKAAVGVENIHHIETAYTRQALTAWEQNPRLHILGNTDASKRVGIISFTIDLGERGYLHPRFVATLLNDLFGIQTRAGCSCAGPYAHRLLGLSEADSQTYRKWINQGFGGVRPGWCRLGFHYTQDQAEVDFVIRAVNFVADHGEWFLPSYEFNVKNGRWRHSKHQRRQAVLDVQHLLQAEPQISCALDINQREAVYTEYLEVAHQQLEHLKQLAPELDGKLAGDLAEAQYFCLASHSG